VSDDRIVLTPRQASALLGCSYGRVLDLIHAGHIATIPHFGDKHYKIARRELDRFVNEGVQQIVEEGSLCS
jgi:excisionase family DNA binding protein